MLLGRLKEIQQTFQNDDSTSQKTSKGVGSVGTRLMYPSLDPRHGMQNPIYSK